MSTHLEAPTIGPASRPGRLAAGVRAGMPLVVPVVGATVALGWVLAPATAERDFALAAVLVAALAGISVSTTGIYGGVLVPGLLLLGMDVAFVAALSLALQLVVVPIGALDHHRLGNIRRSITIPLIIGGAAGAATGALLATSVPEDVVERAVAALIVGIGALVLIRVRPGSAHTVSHPPFGRILGIGGAAGFASGISGAGWGPIGVKLLILSNIDPRQAIGSSLVGRGFMALAAITTYILTSGLADGGSQTWLIAIPLLGASLAGVAAGARFVTQLSQRRAVVLVALFSITLAMPTLLKGVW